MMNTFFDRYAQAFEAYDVDALLALYRWPVVLVTTGSSVVWNGPE